MILENRAASSPTVLIESGRDSSIVSEVELNDGQLEGTHNFCYSMIMIIIITMLAMIR